MQKMHILPVMVRYTGKAWKGGGRSLSISFAAKNAKGAKELGGVYTLYTATFPQNPVNPVNPV